MKPYTGVFVQYSDDQGKTWGDCVELSESPTRSGWITYFCGPDLSNVRVGAASTGNETYPCDPEGYLAALSEECAYRNALSERYGTVRAFKWRAVPVNS